MLQHEDEYLFKPSILIQLSQYHDLSSKLAASGDYIVRPLKSDDYSKGYLELLSQLTHVGDMNEAEFSRRFSEIKAINQLSEHYIIVVIEDTKVGKVIAASTLFIELKFIHQCTKRGRLEDVAVLKEYRGKKIGEILVSIIVALAKEIYDCYKLTLDCSDELKKFYAKNDFSYACNMLNIRFK